MKIQLGEFEVLSPLAEGGMGAVWRAVHPGQKLPVAIKVMAEDLVTRERWRDAFRTEVRSMARLEHPGVAWVFDYGVVSAAAHEASMGKLPLNSPWMAMEFASDGTVYDRIGRLSWPSVRLLLLSVLDVLGHAHARRVIHRDLKPANLLLCGAQDLRPGLKLTDFGIAAALDGPTTPGDGMTGTPAYMAPEQILASRGDLGPWTDLYALGCVAWELVSGGAPFENVPGNMLFAHVGQPLPEFKPRFEVPQGFEEWLRVLLAKMPVGRYQCAADAAHALRGLQELEEGQPLDPRLAPLLRQSVASTVPLTSGGFRPRPSRARADTWFDEETLDDSADYSVDEAAPEAVRPGCPLHWRRVMPLQRPRQLQGAGLGLVGLRAVPLAGRRPERDALWAAMVDVWTHGRGRAVVLRGAAGTGKSRLARWLGERAEELGVAQWLLASHHVDANPAEGVRRAIDVGLGTAHTGIASRRLRLRRQLGSGDGLAAETHAWLHPRDDAATVDRPAGERHALIARILHRMSQGRPVVLHLDDVQWSTDALRLALQMVCRQAVEPSTVLLVLTVQEEALAEQPRAQALLTQLIEQPEVTQMLIEPLPRDQRVSLLDGLLGLDAAAATQVLERAGGNPLFAVQLVGDWVARGVLKPSGLGYTIADPGQAAAVSSLNAIWVERLQRLLLGLPEHTGAWLERAALMGNQVVLQRWRGVSGGLTLGRDRTALAETLLERLCVARLAVESVGGFTFVHGLFRDAIIGQAREAGRLVGHHDIIADFLQHHDQQPVQLARHLVAAGRGDEAVAFLVAGLAEHRVTAGDREVLALCDLADQALAGMNAPLSDERRGAIGVQRVFALATLGESDESEQGALSIEADAIRYGWDHDLRLQMLLHQHRGAVRRGALDVADALLNRVVRDPHAQLRHLASVCVGRFGMGEFRNDLAYSEDQAHKAEVLFERIGDDAALVKRASIMAILGLMLHKPQLTERWATEALERAKASGSLMAQARALHNLGKAAWVRRDLDLAEERLIRSEGLFLQAGNVAIGNPRLVRVLVMAHQRRFSEALAIARDLRDNLGRGRPNLPLRIVMLVIDVGLGNFRDTSDQLAQIQSDLLARGRCNGEDAAAAEFLGDLANEAGEVAVAWAAWLVALDQWDRHDNRDVQVAQVREKLDALA